MPEWQVFYSFAFESNHSHRVGIIYGGNKWIWLTFCVWSTKQKGVSMYFDLYRGQYFTL